MILAVDTIIARQPLTCPIDDVCDKGFSKAERILAKAEYQRVFNRGVRIRKKPFNLYLFLRKDGKKRIGIAVSKKVGNAVVRNRAKRILREVFRNNKTLIPGADIVIVVYPSFRDNTYQEIERTFLAAVHTPQPG